MLRQLILIIALLWPVAVPATTLSTCALAEPRELAGAWSGFSPWSSEFYLLILKEDLSRYLTISSSEEASAYPLLAAEIRGQNLFFAIDRDSNSDVSEFYLSLSKCSGTFDKPLLKPFEKLPDDPDAALQGMIDIVVLIKGKEGIRQMLEQNQTRAEQVLKLRDIAVPY